MKKFNPLKVALSRSILVLAGIIISGNSFSQSKLPARALQVSAGYSRHGSGDMGGIVFGAEYIQYKSRKFSLHYNFRSTINDSKEKIIVHNTTADTRTDASIRFTTAGFQLGVTGGLNLVRTSRSELMIGLGVFGRFQSASNGTDGYSMYYPPVTGQPTVLIGYDNHTPMQTIAVGGIFQFHYNYTFRNNVYLGLSPAFQTDSNGDAIPQATITFGRRF